RVPGALPDGRIPPDATNPFLLVQAPIVDVPGSGSLPGDRFIAIVDGDESAASATEYVAMKDDYVELRIPTTRIDELADGFHALSYRVYPDGFGRQALSGATLIDLDRTPAGGRLLPGIRFSESVIFEGLSLATLLSLPNAELVGIIPDYADVHPADVIHVYMHHRESALDFPAAVLSASTDGSPITVRFDRLLLEQIDGTGRVDFYYYVVDPVGLKSPNSAVTPLNLAVKGGPERLPPPGIKGGDDGLVSDADIRPSLVVEIPALTPQAKAGDTIQLYLGTKAFGEVEIEPEDIGSGPLKTLSIDYATMWKLAARETTAPFEITARYLHRRAGVNSWSDSATYSCDFTLPGGADPVPATPEHEALDKPVLRGVDADEDNVITFADSTKPATVRIGNDTNASSRVIPAFERGDTIYVKMGDTVVGAPHTFDGEAYPIYVNISAKELNEHAGFSALSYDVVRELSTSPHTAVAQSPAQLIRIDSAQALPGAGLQLAPSIFLQARAWEGLGKAYGLEGRDFVDGFTPLRLFGYANMNAGDKVVITFTAFDRYDDGNRVPEADFRIDRIIVPGDLVAKADPDPVTGDLIYVDMKFPIDPAKTLVHGHFEYSHTINNAAGPGFSASKNVTIKVRF
ncbi:hypothetical protein, partial [Luteibacter sp.]|uniref:hypothetical protein n=1 Tax=Luteibacter sp. TaxID=1886636 RepID=UPI003F7F862B